MAHYDDEMITLWTEQDEQRMEAIMQNGGDGVHHNQCDGCARGLPIKNGIHRGVGWDAIGCSKRLYVNDINNNNQVLPKTDELE